MPNEEDGLKPKQQRLRVALLVGILLFVLLFVAVIVIVVTTIKKDKTDKVVTIAIPTSNGAFQTSMSRADQLACSMQASRDLAYSIVQKTTDDTTAYRLASFSRDTTFSDIKTKKNFMKYLTDTLQQPNNYPINQSQ
ncbi:unnamed protein product [Auanema sp. JU1783]|nr:unnamed protein product [Auanema sp. JU1783]